MVLLFFAQWGDVFDPVLVLQFHQASILLALRMLERLGRASGANGEVVMGAAGRFISILLVGAQPRILQGLRMRLGLESDMQVVGEAGSADTAIGLLYSRRPDVLLLDAETAGVDYIKAVEYLRAAFPSVSIILVSLHDSPQTLLRSSEAGVSAFVAKHTVDTHLVAAIRSVVSLNDAS